MNIKDFLLARTAEDEEYAYHALGLLGAENPWWKWADLKARFETLSRSDAQHIERHGPRRVLAECAAKREVIEMHRISPGPSGDDLCTMCVESGPNAQAFPCDTLRALAAVYSDHPGYRPEWAV